ncbi:AzlC family ABC transporter permease [Glutamicibacter halophytocola]
MRNAVYGMQIKQALRPLGKQVPWMAQVTIDESTAVSLGQAKIGEKRRGFVTAGVGVYMLWNLFTLAGAVLGEQMGDPAAWGLDGAAVAAFIGLLWPRLKSMRPVLIAVAAAVLTALAVPISAPGLPILITAVCAAIYALCTVRKAPPATEHGGPRSVGEEQK